MAHVDIQYNKLVKAVLNDGFTYLDKSRDNIKMLQIPDYKLEIDMLQGFPLLTTKRIYWKACIHELIWMLSGSTNIDYLQEQGIKIWDKDALNYSNGSEVGRIYGAQWRSWFGAETSLNRNGTLIQAYYIDQIKNLIKGLKNDLYNRRHIVTTWNPAELEQMALPPCHWAFEILPCNSKTVLDFKGPSGFALKWHQRSCDLMLGIPFDIVLYAALGQLIEKEINLPFIKLIGDLSNIHFYEPHIKLARLQQMREPSFLKSSLLINPLADFNRLTIHDFQVNDYEPHLPIKAELFAKVNK